MASEFPGAVPEIPVRSVGEAAAYYVNTLEFTVDWGDESGASIGGISKGQCRLFLTDRSFREPHGNAAPVVIWLNLPSNREVDELHANWRSRGARIVSPPESKPWKLHEFTAADLDGNLLRVFHDFRHQ